MPKMNVNLTLTKDYGKNYALASKKTNPNKPNSNPISKGQNRLPKNPATHRDLIVPFTRNQFFGIMALNV